MNEVKFETILRSFDNMSILMPTIDTNANIVYHFGGLTIIYKLNNFIQIDGIVPLKIRQEFREKDNNSNDIANAVIFDRKIEDMDCDNTKVRAFIANDEKFIDFLCSYYCYYKHIDSNEERDNLYYDIMQKYYIDYICKCGLDVIIGIYNEDGIIYDDIKLPLFQYRLNKSLINNLLLFDFNVNPFLSEQQYYKPIQEVLENGISIEFDSKPNYCELSIRKDEYYLKYEVHSNKVVYRCENTREKKVICHICDLENRKNIFAMSSSEGEIKYVLSDRKFIKNKDVYYIFKSDYKFIDHILTEINKELGEKIFDNICNNYIEEHEETLVKNK